MNKEAILVFVDQPVGSGYSYCDIPNYIAKSTWHDTAALLSFLSTFYAENNFKKLTSNPTFFFGWSYGNIFF